MFHCLWWPYHEMESFRKLNCGLPVDLILRTIATTGRRGCMWKGLNPMLDIVLGLVTNYHSIQCYFT